MQINKNLSKFNKKIHKISSSNKNSIYQSCCSVKKKVIAATSSGGGGGVVSCYCCCSCFNFCCHWSSMLLMLSICIYLLHFNAAAPSPTPTMPPLSTKLKDQQNVWPPLQHFDIWNTDLATYREKQQYPDTEEQQQTLESNNDDFTVSGVQLQDYFEYTTPLGNNETIRINNRDTEHRHGKVIHLFPVPVDGECLSDDGRRLGNCFNAYECHQKGGTAKGECAMGFGVCCVFIANCNTTITNNITYLVSPNFPSFMPNNISACSLKVKLMSADISQIRIDFYHFSLGQPNRRNGVCDGDVFNINGGPSGLFSLCGQNSGQHIYYDVGGRALPRQSPLYGNLRPLTYAQIYPNISTNGSTTSVTEQLIDITLNFTNRFLPIRLYEIRIAQIPFSQRAPAGCLQYFTGVEGIMQTFNFADNGRHLANQHYRICMRQETDMCSIIYQPCDEQSFRIGGSGVNMMNMLRPNGAAVGSGSSSILNNNSGVSTTNLMSNITDAASTNAMGNSSSTTATSSNGTATTVATTSTTLANTTSSATPERSSTVSSPATTTTTAATTTTTEATTTTTAASTVNDDPDDLEGSGDDDDFQPVTPTQTGVSRRPRPVGGGSGGFDLLGFLRSAFDLRLRRRLRRRREARQFFSTCSDRITMPCIIEDFIGTGLGPLPGCEPVHCGAQFCSSGVWPCRIESTVTPFYIGVHFGDGAGKGSAEENIGACLRYTQVQCM